MGVVVARKRHVIYCVEYTCTFLAVFQVKMDPKYAALAAMVTNVSLILILIICTSHNWTGGPGLAVQPVVDEAVTQVCSE